MESGFLASLLVTYWLLIITLAGLLVTDCLTETDVQAYTFITLVS